MRRVEHHHHTAEQVTGYLDEALSIVGALGVSDELLVPAFTKAVELLSAKTIEVEQFAGPLEHLAIPNRR